MVYRETAHPGPKLSFQAHPTQIYSLAFAGDAAEPLLIRYRTVPYLPATQYVPISL